MHGSSHIYSGVTWWPSDSVPPRDIREIRALVRHRAALVRMRATVKNRVHAIIDGYGFRCTYSDMFGKGGLRWLRGLELAALDRRVLGKHPGHVEGVGRA